MAFISSSKGCTMETKTMTSSPKYPGSWQLPISN
uniref:Uncharacterized protein n=1 Tax=Triticum urartu TaxID=4572 RepID=A0A8R7UPS6_TRIUA